VNGVKIEIEGSNGIFRIGEGQSNHYPILAEKRFWFTQFCIFVKEGNFYLQDFGIMYPSRIKIDKTTEIRIFEDALVDLGKGVLYRFDSLSYSRPPLEDQSDFLYWKKEQNEYVETEKPSAYARAIWVSSNSNSSNFEGHELHIEAPKSRKALTVGRNKTNDVVVSLDAVSGDHCRIEYNEDKGWMIYEKGK